MAAGPLGAEPLLVQIGFTRFALRRAEAARVRVAPRRRSEADRMQRRSPLRIALVGNPNCGKTALFNLLTGSRQKVANYAGVTVERKEGRFHAPSGRRYALLDLPGAYSLHAASLDEAITRDLCRGFYPGRTGARRASSASSMRPTCACTCASRWKCAHSAGRWCSRST